MYASRSRCDSPARSTFATAFEPSESSASYTSPMQPPPIGRARTSLVPSTASTLSEIRRSAMIREVLLLDLLQKPLRRLLDKIHNVLEALRSSVVGVRHLGLGTPRREVQEDLALEPLAPQDALEDALSQRRAADVSHTDKEDAYHRVGF